MGTKLPALPEHADLQALPPPRPAEPKTRRRSWTWLWLLILAALSYGGYRYYQAAQQKKATAAAAQAARMGPRAVPIVAAPARSMDMPIYLRGLGSVAPFNNVTVKSRVDGQLIAIHFTEGQLVKKGQLLAEIDPRPFQVQLEQAEGQRARDVAQSNDAKANLARYEALWKEQVIARQQLDTQRAAVGQFEGAMQADQGAIDNAKLNLTYSKITAPIAGRIGLRLVDAGNIIHPGDPNGLANIAQLQPIAVLFTVPADDLPAILGKLRSGVHLRVDAYDREEKNKIASGSLLTLDNQIDPATGTSRLKAVFDNAASNLFPNQFVNCRLLLETRRNTVVVPAPAIQRGPQGTYVYLVTPRNTATVRQVTAGVTEGNDVAVERGLQPGDMVVIDGQDKLQEGTKVDVRTPGAAPARRKRPEL